MYRFDWLADIAILAVPILVVLSLMTACIYGIVMNVRKRRQLEEIRLAMVDARQKAEEVLARAHVICSTAALEQDAKVCDACQRITTRYLEDENGITCIGCASNTARSS